MLHLRAAVHVDEAVAVEVVLDDDDGSGLVAVELAARLGVALDVRDGRAFEDGDVVVGGGLGLAVEPEAGGDLEVVKHGWVSEKRWLSFFGKHKILELSKNTTNKEARNRPSCTRQLFVSTVDPRCPT